MNAAHFGSPSLHKQGPSVRDLPRIEGKGCVCPHHRAQHSDKVTPQRSLFECVVTTFGLVTSVLFCSAEQVGWCLPGGGGGGGGGGGVKAPWISAPLAGSSAKCCALDPSHAASATESSDAFAKQRPPCYHFPPRVSPQSEQEETG